MNLDRLIQSQDGAARFNVNRMGEQYADVRASWLASITSVSEFLQVKKLEVGASVSFDRAVTGPVGKTLPLTVTRVS